jgi:hypothetical protein
LTKIPVDGSLVGKIVFLYDQEDQDPTCYGLQFYDRSGRLMASSKKDIFEADVGYLKKEIFLGPNERVCGLSAKSVQNFRKTDNAHYDNLQFVICQKY